VATLRQVAVDLHHPVIQASVSLATQTDAAVLAWVFMHSALVDDAELGPIQVRFVEAVDTDGTAYVLTHLPDQPTGLLAVHDTADADSRPKPSPYCMHWPPPSARTDRTRPARRRPGRAPYRRHPNHGVALPVCT